MVFHERLIQRRKELGMTQEELADKLGVSRQSVSKWENGDSMPDADKLIKLSDALEIGLDDLTGREVTVEPIVLRAPDVPKPHGKRRRRIAALIAAIVLIGAACFFGGMLMCRAGKLSATESTDSRLPDKLTASGLSIQYSEGVMTCTFVANADLDGTLYLYPQDSSQEPIAFEAVYKNGAYSATANAAPDVYGKLVFNVSENDIERSVLLAEDVELIHNADGWGNGWREP